MSAHIVSVINYFVSNDYGDVRESDSRHRAANQMKSRVRQQYAVIVVGRAWGLTLALQPARRRDRGGGLSAPEILPLGVGINVLPHAVRELTELGLGDELARRGIATQSLIYTNRFGQEIWREPRGKAAGYNWPQYSIHRGALQAILLEAVSARLGPDSVNTNHEATRVELRADGAAVNFRAGSTGEPLAAAEGDLVVAADGIHSALRAQFYPDEGPPIWNRRVLWRGVTEGCPFLGGRTMVMAGHENVKFVCYPIDPAADDRGTAVINCIAELRFPDEATWRREDWNRRGRLQYFLPQFEDWRFP